MVRRTCLAVALALMPGALSVPSATGLVGPTAQSAANAATPRVHRSDLAPGTYEIAFSARQQAVFVASTGDAKTPSRILRLDPVTLELRRAIALDRRAYGLTLDDASDRLYVGHSTDGAVSVVDTTTDRLVQTVQLVTPTKNAAGQDSYPHNLRELAVDRINNRLFAPGLAVEDSALYVMDTRALTLEKVIPGIGFVATGLALDASAGRVYVSNLEGKGFVFDTRTLALLHTWNLGIDQPLNLAIDPKGGLLYATDEGIESITKMRSQRLPNLVSNGPGHRAVVLDARTGAQLASFPVGRQPIAPLLDLTRSRLFVTNREDGSVTVFDTNTRRLLHTISLPAHPNSLALDATTGVVYVTIKARSGSPQGTLESVARIELP